jgi:hypothetical protein
MTSTLKTLVVCLCLAGCATESRSDVQTTKRIVTVTRTLQQVYAPNGDLVLLEGATKVVTDETGQQIGESETISRPPQVLSVAAKVVGTGIAALTGSATAGQAAEAGVNWISGLLGAGAAGGTAGGAGWLALRRTRRQRDELIEGVEKSKDVLSEEDWDKVKAKLASAQSSDTQRVVYEMTP